MTTSILSIIILGLFLHILDLRGRIFALDMEKKWLTDWINIIQPERDRYFAELQKEKEKHHE